MLILNIFGGYLLLGCAFGVAFFLRGYAALAPEARHASVILRLMWSPAAIMLWPLLLGKWVAGKWSRRERSPKTPPAFIDKT